MTVRRRVISIVLSLHFVAASSLNGDDEIKHAARQRQYLRYAQSNSGDARNGQRLYEEHQTLQCRNCHNIIGMEKSGPNLDGIADKFPGVELIRQVLYPSESIKVGFEQYQLVTDDGKVYTGRIERANKNVHRIIDATGKQTDVRTSSIETKTMSPTSMMPENLVSAITPDEFADLMAYLRTLSFGIHEGLIAGRQRIEIPRLKNAIDFVLIHPAEMKFENPVWCGALPGTESDMVVIEHQTGKIWRLIRDDEAVSRELFLDLGKEIHYSNNQGVMCMAFHPEYEMNRRYFVKHEVEEEGTVKTTIVERRASSDGLRDSGQPSVRLLEVFQPAFNHNGGCVTFGPDGMLYTAFGDGGPQEDPPGYSQNLSIFHGSMLRIDVDQTRDGKPYSIPADNPFVAAHQSDPSIRPEIWAFGFREPWRFSFDAATGDLYVGDVGQNKFEEVSLVQRGENHGWNVREAFTDFSDEYRRDGETYVDPIFAYEHGLGFSVTGGHVYRGKQNESFDGVYIFGDYNTRLVWGMKQAEGKVQNVIELGTAPGGIASFGVDQHGEIYLVTYAGFVYHVDLSKSEYPE